MSTETEKPSGSGTLPNYFHGWRDGYQSAFWLGTGYGIGLALFGVWLWSAVAKVIN